jgi:hypothetical protein
MKVEPSLSLDDKFDLRRRPGSYMATASAGQRPMEIWGGPSMRSDSSQFRGVGCCIKGSLAFAY